MKVVIEKKDHNLNFEINKPEALNCLDKEVLETLDSELDKLAERFHSADVESPRSVTFTGSGDRAFIAGADIKLMREAKGSALEDFIRLGQRVMRKIETLPIATVAVIDGYALGGGLELAVACDLIIATNRSKFGQPEVNLGIIPGFGATQRLMQRTGVGVAKRLILTGETVDADFARRRGLVDYVVEPNELSRKVAEVSGALAGSGPLAVTAAKRAIESFFSPARENGLETEVEEFIGLFKTNDCREGLNAFIEKRKPNFKCS